MNRICLVVFSGVFFLVFSCATGNGVKPLPVVLPEKIPSSPEVKQDNKIPLPYVKEDVKKQETTRTETPEIIIVYSGNPVQEFLHISGIPLPALHPLKPVIISASPLSIQKIAESGIPSVSAAGAVHKEEPEKGKYHTVNPSKSLLSGKNTSDREIVSSKINDSIKKELTFYHKGKVPVHLDGTGWIVTNVNPGKGIEFDDKLILENNDIFYFSVSLYGNFTITFQKQNNEGFSGKELILLLHCKEKKDKKGVQDTTVEGKADMVPVKSLDEYIDYGNYKKAFEVYPEPNVLHRLLIKGINTSTVEPLIPFYNEVYKNAEPLKFVFKEKDFIPLVIDAGKLFISKKFIKQGVHILETCLSGAGENYTMDSVLFILGSVYQNEKAVRNEKKAVFYYKKLVDEYPASVYWDEAHKEYMFLKRRYIDIR